MEENEKCPQCKKNLDDLSCRLVQDACGHKKCRMCLLNDETKCMLCTDVDAKEPAQRQNVINHTAVITCQSKICDEIALGNKQASMKCDVFTKRNDETDHKRQLPSHISVKEEERDGFTCNICNKSFTTRSHIRYHSYCAGGIKPYQCEVCKKSFIIKSHLQTHQLIHENRKPFKCDTCEKTFMERSKLNRHKFVHMVNKTFICQECGKSFKNKENLRTHMIIHKPEKPYKCSECEASFSHSSNLKKHTLTHSDEKAHMCDQCGKRFKCKWTLTLHRKTHLRIKAFQCETCKKTFMHTKDLQRHELIHIDAKAFMCGHCATSFKRKDNLNRHTKNTHPGKEIFAIRNFAKRNQSEKEAMLVDKSNAINVITAPPAQVLVAIPRSQEAAAPTMKPPLKLAFKTSAFKNNYNISSEEEEKEKKDPFFSVYEKILIPTGKSNITNQPCEDGEIECPAQCQRLFTPYSRPYHYETSFDNKQHAVIKNIKFKLPAKYTKLKSNEKFGAETTKAADAQSSQDEYAEAEDPVKRDEEKGGSCEVDEHSVNDVATPSVIVNGHDLHWRRRTSQYLNSK